jgi:hypothetical protein
MIRDNRLSSQVQIPIVMAAAVATLTGCGGGGDNAAFGATYPFVTPAVGAMRTYSETITDSSSNTVGLNFTSQVTAVDSDHSYTDTLSGNNVVTLDGQIFGATENRSFNSEGQELSYTYSASNGGTGSCTYDPNGAGPPYPLSVGQTWRIQFSYSCNGNAPITYTQNGSVVDIESVTVPAGTFSAVKLQSTITWTNSQGTTRQESITNWRDVATLQSVKESITYTVSGTPPSGAYVTNESTELLSASS